MGKDGRTLTFILIVVGGDQAEEAPFEIKKSFFSLLMRPTDGKTNPEKDGIDGLPKAEDRIRGFPHIPALVWTSFFV